MFSDELHQIIHLLERLDNIKYATAPSSHDYYPLTNNIFNRFNTKIVHSSCIVKLNNHIINIITHKSHTKQSFCIVLIRNISATLESLLCINFNNDQIIGYGIIAINDLDELYKLIKLLFLT